MAVWLAKFGWLPRRYNAEELLNLKNTQKSAMLFADVQSL